MLNPSGSCSTGDLSRASGDIIAEAPRHPVVITQRNMPRLVLLNIKDYQRLMSRAGVRAAGTIETTSDSMPTKFEEAVEAYAAVEEEGQQ